MPLFTNTRIVTPGEVLERGTLVVENGSITAIVGAGAHPPNTDETIDADGLTVLPGFLDLHIHGGGGADTMDGASDALRTICRLHARHGTTGLLLTTMTQSREAITTALATAAEACRNPLTFCADGAQPLGIHLEGPYINAERAGAQPREFVRDYDAAEFAEWLALTGETMRRITLAPERPGADSLMAPCRAAGIVISLGHTDADTDQTNRALANGAASGTHLFNAMPPVHHRKPGAVTALLLDPNATVEVIADGHHLHPDIIRLILALKGSDRVHLITDAMAGAGSGDGVYGLGGHTVTVQNGRALLADGTLAGSVLTLDVAARNLREWTGIGWSEIARLTSGNAADAMGWAQKGRLIPGADADLVLVDDNLTVHATYVAGRCVYHHDR